MFHLDDHLKKYQAKVNEALVQFLGEPSVEGNETVYRSAIYSLNAGGKRIRPILAISTAKALGRDAQFVMPLACALEMIHTYSLIHDDLPAMDNDDLRRGKPTNHKKFGEACAILAGDCLLTKAFEVLASAPGMTLEVIRDVAAAAGVDGMVGGQMMDLESESKDILLSDLERIHRHKTGALLRVSVTASAKLAGAKPAQIECLGKYGRAIGLAFQIADDILDIEGGEEIGKDVGSDVDNAKATYPKLMGLDASKEKAKEVIQVALNALEGFDAQAEPLREIAKYIINRNM